MAESGLANLDKELSAVLPQKGAVKREQKKAPQRQKKKAGAAKIKVVISKARRKAAVARAVIKPGTGKVTINGMDANLLKPKEVRETIFEPLRIIDSVEQFAKSVDISINVYGGGVSGQAQATRTAIAKAMVLASGNESLRKTYIDYDRNMFVDDYRNVEPKKFRGPKARARFQKSYR